MKTKNTYILISVLLAGTLIIGLTSDKNNYLIALNGIALGMSIATALMLNLKQTRKH
ncbi:MAG: hypothetical protein QM613_06565 [Micrococcaceae bacterium]